MIYNMKLETKYHGVVEYIENDIITFSKGLPGFQELKKFVIFPVEGNEVFSILHSIENEEVGFVITSPFSIKQDYEFELDDQRLEELKIANEKQVEVYNTVTLHSKVESITVNLRAPIVVNTAEKLGEQVILNNDKYLVKHPFIEEEA